jgi:hypothetical protein
VLDLHAGRFHCPRCGVEGDAADLVALVRGLDREAARRWLEDGEDGDLRAAWEALLRRAVSHGPEIEAARHAIGVSAETLRRLGGRYVSDYRGTMLSLAASFPMEMLRRSGLFNRREHLIFWRHRLVLPYRDGGKVVHLAGIGPGEIHLRGRPVPVPYNVAALEGARGEVAVTASVRDALALEEWGCPSVAVPEPPGLLDAWLPRFEGRRLLVIVDDERGGRKAAEDRARALRRVARDVDVVEVPGRGPTSDRLRDLAAGSGGRHA